MLLLHQLQLHLLSQHQLLLHNFCGFEDGRLWQHVHLVNRVALIPELSTAAAMPLFSFHLDEIDSIDSIAITMYSAEQEQPSLRDTEAFVVARVAQFPLLLCFFLVVLQLIAI